MVPKMRSGWLGARGVDMSRKAYAQSLSDAGWVPRSHFKAAEVPEEEEGLRRPEFAGSGQNPEPPCIFHQISSFHF